MLLLLDNYDSFTFNLAHYFMELGEEVLVRRNDEITPDEAEELAPHAICLSPGPGTPERAGRMPALIARFAGRVPMLGVCLGHQAIAAHFGAKIARAPELVHGKTSRIEHDGTGLFEGIPSQFAACRYHSLCVDPASVPACLRGTARTAQGVIMAIEHRDLPLWGVQFHPEAILTEHGHKLLKNFLSRAANRGAPVLNS